MNAMTPSLPHIMIEPLVRMALLEDLGRAGDLTTDAIVPADRRATTLLVARQPGVVAGLDLARLAFQLIDPAIEMRIERRDGATLAPGDVIADISGPARGILTAERVALNFLCRLSGIATRDGIDRCGCRQPQGKDRLHPQDDAGPARDREICRPRRRRQQSPVRPRRCRADQGQPCRHRRQRRRSAEARASAASAIWSRSSSRSIRSISSTRRSTTASMPCCSTICRPMFSRRRSRWSRAGRSPKPRAASRRRPRRR